MKIRNPQNMKTSYSLESGTVFTLGSCPCMKISPVKTPADVFDCVNLVTGALLDSSGHPVAVHKNAELYLDGCSDIDNILCQAWYDEYCIMMDTDNSEDTIVAAENNFLCLSVVIRKCAESISLHPSDYVTNILANDATIPKAWLDEAICNGFAEGA